MVVQVNFFSESEQTYNRAEVDFEKSVHLTAPIVMCRGEL